MQRRSLLAAAEAKREALPAHSGMALSHAGAANGAPLEGPVGGTRTRWGAARPGGSAWHRAGAQPGAPGHGGHVSGAPLINTSTVWHSLA